MVKRPFKKGSSASFVMLERWVLESASWLSLKPGPRVLYLELKRIFNGSNNGALYLSHRDAAARLNVGRDTVAGYYRELISWGFILQTRGHCLGPSGVGQSATYALTELPLNGSPATKEFMRRKNKTPAGKPDVFWQENPTTPLVKFNI